MLMNFVLIKHWVGYGESVSDEWGYEKNQSALHDRLAVFFAAAWVNFFLSLLTASRILFGG